MQNLPSLFWTSTSIVSTSFSMTWDEEIDATGLLCPLPVLKARKRLKAMQDGSVLRLIATDPAAVVDVPHFCNESGHSFLGTTQEGDATAYLIRKVLS